MSTFNRFLAALVTLFLSSCCCPQPCGPTQMNHAANAYASAGQSSAGHANAPEFPISPDCAQSKPAYLTGNTPTQRVLPVVPRCQEGLYSCWSTSTEMILEFLDGTRVRQCEQSNQAFRHEHCCGPNTILVVDPTCDIAWIPEFEQWGYTCDYREKNPLDQAGVVAEIDAGRPFAFSWIREDPTDQTVQVIHMLVVIGYGAAQSGGPGVFILDPHVFQATDARIIPLADYRGTAPAANQHADDFVKIQPLQ